MFGCGCQFIGEQVCEYVFVYIIVIDQFGGVMVELQIELGKYVLIVGLGECCIVQCEECFCYGNFQVLCVGLFVGMEVDRLLVVWWYYWCIGWIFWEWMKMGGDYSQFIGE